MENEPILSISNAGIVETDGTLSFQIQLSEAASSDVTVTATPYGAAALEGSDFTATQQTVTIPAGSQSATFDVTIFADTLSETDENIFVELANPSGARFADDARTIQATGVIRDDDAEATAPSLFAQDVRVVEGDTGQATATFDVVLSRALDTDLSVPYATVAGSATAGADFEGASGSLSFAAGETEATVDVPILSDTTAEGGERFALRLDAAGSIANGTEGRVAEALILDDDSASGGTPTVNVDNLRLSESVGNFLFPVLLSEAAASDVTLDYRTRDATADGEDDFVVSQDSVTVASGETTAYVSIEALGDSLTEADERFVLEFANAEGAALAGDAPVLRAQGLMRDDDTASPSAAVFVDDVRVVEGDGGTATARFDVTLSRPQDTALSFDYTTVAGSATAGEDFTAASGSLAFAPGQQHQTVSVEVGGDALPEANETFSLVLDSDEALGNGRADMAAVATIHDDDAADSAPVLSVEDVHRVEEFSNMVFTVALSEAAGEDVTVDYAVRSGTAIANDDFAEQRDSVTIPAGDDSATFDIELFTDETAEPDESFIVELSDPEGASLPGDAHVLSARGVIRNDDGSSRAPSLFVDDVRLVEGDSGTREAVFDVTLSRALDEAVTLPFTTRGITANAGTDFEATSGSLTFAAGQTSASVAVSVFGDRAVEDTDSFALDVGGAPLSDIDLGASGVSGIARILDDDAGTGGSLPTASISGATAIERTGEMAFTVSLSEPTDRAVGIEYTTVDGTATAGEDYEASSDIAVVPAGATAARFTVRTLEDSDTEETETFTVQATEAIDAVLAGSAESLTATGRILDDDGSDADSLPVMTVNAPSVGEPESGTGTASFTVSLSADADRAVSADYQILAGTAEAAESSGGGNGDVVAASGSLSIPAGESSATVDATVLSDGKTEDAESFVLRIDNIENAQGQAGADTAVGIGTIEANAGAETTLPLLDLTPREQVAAVFTAYFGRAPNPGGLDFWVGELQTSLEQGKDNGQVLADIASSFAADTDPGEAIALFPFLANPDNASDSDIEAFIGQVFLNVFNREPGTEGLTFWRDVVKDMIAGPEFVGNAIIDIVSGAQNSEVGNDWDTVQNKISAGLSYAAEMTRRGSEFTLDDDQADAQAVITDVTDVQSTLEAGIALAEERVAADAAEEAAPGLVGVAGEAEANLIG